LRFDSIGLFTGHRAQVGAGIDNPLSPFTLWGHHVVGAQWESKKGDSFIGAEVGLGYALVRMISPVRDGFDFHPALSLGLTLGGRWGK
jgi:hypothetical protein